MHIVRYLKGSINLGSVFSSEVKLESVANVDASYLIHEDSKSHSGICYSLGEGNMACKVSKAETSDPIFSRGGTICSRPINNRYLMV